MIPVVDLEGARRGGGAERFAVAREIDQACCDIGFFTLTGHGVPERTIDDLRAAAHAFFALPLDDKVRARHPVPGTNRGYHPVGREALSTAMDEAAPPDLKEFFHVGPVDVTDDPYYTSALGRSHFLPNIWPAAPPDFERAASVYYRTMSDLVVFLMRLTALALGRDETYFDDKVGRSIGTMRLNYYPPQTDPPREGQLRAGAHTDYGGFTILSGEDVPGGLQVRTRAGAWVDVRTRPTELVVNIGDLLMRWTNDRWLSNLHRVVNPPDTGRARLSIAFFNHPNYDALIECIAPPGEASMIRWYARWQRQNADALKEFVDKHKVQVLKTPPEILTEFLKTWDKIAAREADKDPFFKKVLESQRQYAGNVVPTKRFLFPPYDFTANHYWPVKK